MAPRGRRPLWVGDDDSPWLARPRIGRSPQQMGTPGLDLAPINLRY